MVLLRKSRKLDVELRDDCELCQRACAQHGLVALKQAFDKKKATA